MQTSVFVIGNRLVSGKSIFFLEIAEYNTDREHFLLSGLHATPYLSLPTIFLLNFLLFDYAVAMQIKMNVQVINRF